MEIKYIERETGKECVEKIYGNWVLFLLYGDGFFRGLFSFVFLPLLAYVSLFSRFYGYLQKKPSSAKKVVPFIKEYGVDQTEFLNSHFQSFNDFFIRKLKPEKRPIVQGAKILAMPADARYLAYPEFEKFQIKGKRFSLEAFLQNSADANRYKDGSMLIARLCPSDYHRFHFPCDAIPSKAVLINGPLYSVNPMALRKRIEIFSENKRMITEMATEHFGTILYVEIGATSVGSITQTYTPDKSVKKGEEKGYFEFGGSCIVLLFEKGRVQFDEDLIRNTERRLETRAKFGTSFAWQYEK